MAGFAITLVHAPRAPKSTPSAGAFECVQVCHDGTKYASSSLTFIPRSVEVNVMMICEGPRRTLVRLLVLLSHSRMRQAARSSLCDGCGAVCVMVCGCCCWPVRGSVHAAGGGSRSPGQSWSLDGVAVSVGVGHHLVSRRGREGGERGGERGALDVHVPIVLAIVDDVGDR
eukprot:scaffold238513_cov31-Tisochrysis_lutea.AAC.2